MKKDEIEFVKFNELFQDSEAFVTLHKGEHFGISAEIVKTLGLEAGMYVEFEISKDREFFLIRVIEDNKIGEYTPKLSQSSGTNLIFSAIKLVRQLGIEKGRHYIRDWNKKEKELIFPTQADSPTGDQNT